MNRREFITGLGGVFFLPRTLLSQSLPPDSATFNIQPLLSWWNQPLGERLVSDAALSCVATAIQEVYGGTTCVRDARTLPEGAYNQDTQRYGAELLCSSLGKLEFPGITIGVTSVDIFSPNDKSPYWRIIGVGDKNNNVAILSTTRLGETFENKLKISTCHEIGHVYGLEHCLERDCMMRDMGEKGSIDRVEYGRFCDAHLRQLEDSNVQVKSLSPRTS